MDAIEQQAPNTGSQAPKEGPAQDPISQYGEKMENLPDTLKAKLRELVKKAQERDTFARRKEIERVQKNRLMELGIQHMFWNEDMGVFQVGQQGGGLQQDEAG